MRILLLVGTVMLLNSAMSNAASFDCKKAKTLMEKTVCSDSSLSAMDDELAKLYADTILELKNRPRELKNLIKNQRYWLKLVNSGKGAVKETCLSEDYKLRIKQMRHKFNLARATRDDATGPSKDEVMKRLAEQLARLKELARKAEKISILDTGWEGGGAVCETLWKKLKWANVPETTLYANTGQQKRDVYMQLRQMALFNKRLFLSKGNEIEDLTFINYFWNTYRRHFSECDNTRRDSVNLLFVQADTKDGFKQAVLVIILPSISDNKQFIVRKELTKDGSLNISQSLNGSPSDEYCNSILLEKQQVTIKEIDYYVGLIAINDEVMLWEAQKYSSDNAKKWIVYLTPVSSRVLRREISCSFDLVP